MRSFCRHLKRPSTWSLLLAGAMLILLAHMPAPVSQARAPVRDSQARLLELEPLVQIDLHGSTPALAWSPDGRRVAVNAAYEVYSSEQLGRRHQATLGVYVLEATGATRVFLPFVNALHPFWLDAKRVGWVNNFYTGEQAGVFLAEAQAGAAIRKLGDLSAAHRGHLARDGRLLVFADGGHYGWNYLDANTGQTTPAFGPDRSPGSWETPQALIQDQCPKRVGGVEVRADARLGVVLQIAGQRFRLTGARAWLYKHEYAPAGQTGPVQPCLSPDGRHLAFLTPSDEPSGFRLQVVRVPSAVEAASLARPLGEADPSAPLALEPSARMLLHGSTPALAWSPDGRRVVANAAFEYYGHEDQIRRLAPQLGIWVLDAIGGQATQVAAGQGYHPFWFSAGTLGWGHSEYEDGPPGIYTAPAQAKAPVRRIGQVKGVHRTLLAKDGRVLAFIGFPEYHKWSLVDPKSGQLEPLAALSGLGSWDDPVGAYRDQCLQGTAGAKLVTDPELGYVLQVGGRRYALGSRPLFQVSGGHGPTGAGVVQACLSPDGARVAFLSRVAGQAAAELGIAAVPY